MRYALLICADEDLLTRDDPVRFAAFEAFAEKFSDRLVTGFRLRPTTAATSVQVRDGDLVVADGPFAETKEQIGGLYLVECRDLDEAIEVASQIPAARYGTIEVRPVWEL